MDNVSMIDFAIPTKGEIKADLMRSFCGSSAAGIGIISLGLDLKGQKATNRHKPRQRKSLPVCMLLRRVDFPITLEVSSA